MMLNEKTLIGAAVAALFVIALLVALIIREAAVNRRLKADKEKGSGVTPKPDGREASLPVKQTMERGEGAYSYSSVVMDEVLGEKLIGQLKESLRMTEEMYRSLQEKFKDDRERKIEIANDWLNYIEAIDTIKQSRIDYRMNGADGESLRAERDSTNVKLGIENKFKDLQKA